MLIIHVLILEIIRIPKILLNAISDAIKLLLVSRQSNLKLFKSK